MSAKQSVIIKKRGSKSAQERVRLLVVDFLRFSKGTQQRAANTFCITLNAVQKIWKRYQQKGKRGLSSKKRGAKGGTKKLNGAQAAEVRRLIRDRLPDQLKLPFGLWTREAVQRLIAEKYGVELSRKQVGRYLKAWGYSPQKPIRKAFEQKPEAVRQWLNEEFPALQKKSQQQGAQIYFGDETGMRSDHQAGRSYAPKGKTPVIKATGQRFSINMISAITNKGQLEFMIIAERFNSAVFQFFLQQLIRYKRSKIYFVTDGHPAHKTKKLKEWLEQNKEKIEVVFLPSYSPELNPVEYVNQDLKTNIIGKKRAINKGQMRTNAEEFMNKRQKDQRQVQKYFHQSHVKYAA